MSHLPTPEELGEQLKAGKITKEQAVEIMSERARYEALAGLYGPPPDQTAARAGATAKANRVVRIISIMTLVLGLILALLLIWIHTKKQ